ncbi:hypothetical protein ABH922_001999 [Rhodococcus sp. 27YEA15]
MVPFPAGLGHPGPMADARSPPTACRRCSVPDRPDARHVGRGRSIRRQEQSSGTAAKTPEHRVTHDADRHHCLVCRVGTGGHRPFRGERTLCFFAALTFVVRCVPGRPSRRIRVVEPDLPTLHLHTRARWPPSRREVSGHRLSQRPEQQEGHHCGTHVPGHLTHTAHHVSTVRYTSNDAGRKDSARTSAQLQMCVSKSRAVQFSSPSGDGGSGTSARVHLSHAGFTSIGDSNRSDCVQ